ncbi:hypothetical protein JTE90_015310 [Oedothorax gibbosus]|uniref:Latrophilin Cirl n=1 Tax=Oedothorax gibbosus TaxID=931172 RepID=A0AAV6VNU5_9ARAC|nr:hypothetical protein JTE90_015310 [Oedothorax gibbosus]
MHFYRISAIFAILLVAKVVHVSSGGKKGGEASGYKTIYECEGRTLTIVCDEGKINLVRANFGRFSISICNDHGNLDWRVNCMSQDSFLIMQNRCGMKPNCSVNVSSATFHDSCPGTLKYLEVQYHCGTGGPLPALTSTTLSPGYKPTHPTTNVTAIPREKIHTASHRTTTTSTTTVLPFIPLIRTTTTSSPRTVSSAWPVFNKSDVFFEHKEFSPGPTTTTKVPVSYAVPTMPSFQRNATSIRPPPVSTSDIYDEYHCHPVHSRGINWPSTKIGETAYAPCPDGASGTAKWHCNDSPLRWSPTFPDLSQCHSLWLENLKQRIKKGDSIISVISELALISAKKPIFSDDIKRISDLVREAHLKILNSMSNFLDVWHRDHVLRELLMFSVHTLNNIVDSKQGPAWKELQPIDQKRIISNFLQKIDVNALLLSETSSEDSSYNLVKSNVWLSLQILKVRSQESFKFPTYSDISIEEDRGYWLNMKDSIVIPSDAIEDYAKNGFYKLVFVAFNKVHMYLSPGMKIANHFNGSSHENVTKVVNSKIIGATVGRSEYVKLNQPAVITLKHLIETNVTNPICVFWDYNISDWSAQGCHVDSSNITHTVCLCDHLTNFALIMDFKPTPVPSPIIDWMYVVIAVGCIISLFCLIIAVLIMFFRLRPNQCEDSTFIHRNMFVCLLIAELVFLFGIKQTNYELACSLIAGAMQYIFLVTFSWMLFECYHQYITLIQSCETKKSNTWWYYVAAYGVPAIITGIAAVVDPTSYGTNNFCFLQADNYFVFSFVGPAVSIIFGGLVFLFIALLMLYHKLPNTTSVKGKDDACLQKFRSWNRRSFLLIVLLSFTWASALVYINAESFGLAYLFAALNCVQGVTILAFYCFKNEKVKEDIRKLFGGKLCFKEEKQDEPQPEQTENVDNETSSIERDARGFWTLPKERVSTTSSINTRDSMQGLMRNSLHDIQQSATLQNASRLGKLNSNRVPPAFARKKMVGEQDSVLPNVRRHQALNAPKDPAQKYFAHPDSNGQFLDHIYETIDDDALPDEEESHTPFTPGARFLPPENFYGDHSDLSQNSSSSCGYDHQPLINMVPQMGQSLSQIPYPMSVDSHSNNVEQMWEQGHSLRRHQIPSENPVAMKSHCDRIPHNFPPENHHQACSNRMAPETWEPTLPDLLQSPPDNNVVLAVLDGDKVVNRIQQDDVLIKPQYKLSTYC